MDSFLHVDHPTNMAFWQDKFSEDIAKALQESEMSNVSSEQLARFLQEQEEFGLQEKIFSHSEYVAHHPPKNHFPVVDDSTQNDEVIARMLEEQMSRNLSPIHSHPPPLIHNTSPPDDSSSDSDDDVNHGVFQKDALDIDSMSYEQLLKLGEKIGTVEKGVSKHTLTSLPTRIFKSAPNLSSENKTCMVCQEDYANGDKLRILPCIHTFHVACIDQWLKKKITCPVCLIEVKR